MHKFSVSRTHSTQPSAVTSYPHMDILVDQRPGNSAGRCECLNIVNSPQVARMVAAMVLVQYLGNQWVRSAGMTSFKEKYKYSYTSNKQTNPTQLH